MSLLIDAISFNPVVTESKEKPGVFFVEGVMQRAGAKNQNGRIYERAILERECDKYIKEFVEVGNAYGELDHPESPVVSLQNASHIVKDLWWDGDDLCGKVQLLNTPAGNIVKEIVKAGHTIGISSRGTGSVRQTNEGHLAVQDDFELVCWDFVSNPSTQGAFLSPKTLAEGLSAIPNNPGKYDRMNTIMRDIICTTTCACSL